MALMADTEKDLQHKLTGIEEELALKNMKINVEKTKTEKNNIWIQREKIWRWSFECCECNVAK